MNLGTIAFIVWTIIIIMCAYENITSPTFDSKGNIINHKSKLKKK
jgi:hypothetical protein